MNTFRDLPSANFKSWLIGSLHFHATCFVKKAILYRKFISTLSLLTNKLYWRSIISRPPRQERRKWCARKTYNGFSFSPILEERGKRGNDIFRERLCPVRCSARLRFSLIPFRKIQNRASILFSIQAPKCDDNTFDNNGKHHRSLLLFVISSSVFDSKPLCAIGAYSFEYSCVIPGDLRILSILARAVHE